jgi:asparagine synthase (glutamine-hydrolysing)
MFDEPFADASQIPTFLVSRLTRGHVTVALSGDGGDELFGGYDRYRLAAGGGPLGAVPSSLRRAAAAGITALPPAAWDAAAAALPARLRPARFGERLHKLARVLPADGAGGLYRALVSHWTQPERLVPGAVPPDPLEMALAGAGGLPGGLLADPVDLMRFLDLKTYLPDDVLTKVDRASMATALEARVPLLDHRVVAHAWTLPRRHLIRQGTTKWLLRQVLYRYVPRDLVERPKAGFGVPIAAWLRGPLRDWAESLLSARRLAEGGLIEPGPVRAAWAEHLSGRRDHAHALWIVLMAEAWRETWVVGTPIAARAPIAAGVR